MRKGLRILISTSFAFNTAAGAFAPLYAIFVQKVGGGILEASGIWSLEILIIGVLIFLFGRMEDKFNKRKLLVLGYALHTVGFLGYNFVSNIWHLLIVQSFLGIAGAVTIPAFDAFYSKSLDRGKEISEWSIWEGGSRIITASAAIMGGYITAILGFRYLFIFMSAFSLLSTFIVLHLLRKKEYENLSPRRY